MAGTELDLRKVHPPRHGPKAGFSQHGCRSSGDYFGELDEAAVVILNSIQNHFQTEQSTI